METGKITKFKVISVILILFVLIGIYYIYKNSRQSSVQQNGVDKEKNIVGEASGKMQLPEEQAAEEDIPLFEEEQESPAAAKNVPSSEEDNIPEGLFE